MKPWLELGPHRRARPRSGFGLLESIIALALLASSGLALINWIDQSLQSATRLRRSEQEARLLLSAQALIELVNPAEQAAGSLQAGGLTVSWQSQPVEPPRRNATVVDAAPGPWQIGLYRLAVNARDERAVISISFVQFRTGLRRLFNAEGEQ